MVSSASDIDRPVARLELRREIEASGARLVQRLAEDADKVFGAVSRVWIVAELFRASERQERRRRLEDRQLGPTFIGSGSGRVVA